jgi:hypothetical protein
VKGDVAAAQHEPPAVQMEVGAVDRKIAHAEGVTVAIGYLAVVFDRHLQFIQEWIVR